MLIVFPTVNIFSKLWSAIILSFKVYRLKITSDKIANYNGTEEDPKK